MDAMTATVKKLYNIWLCFCFRLNFPGTLNMMELLIGIHHPADSADTRETHWKQGWDRVNDGKAPGFSWESEQPGRSAGGRENNR